MVSIGNGNLLLTDFEKVLFQGEPVVLDPGALLIVKKNYEFLKDYAQDKIIYGINTGLGPMAQIKISEEDQKALQYNLIRSHASGSGDYFTTDLSMATLLARLNSLMRGYSGIHTSTVNLLVSFINLKIAPAIFERGGVGASGDLVQLAHLALNLIGEGDVFIDEKLTRASDAMKAKLLQPLSIYLREGLAIMNGTSVMTGVGMVNLIYAKKLLSVSIMLSAITNELMKSFDDHFSFELNHVKCHEGQGKIAALMRQVLTDSKLIRKRPDHLYHRKIVEAVFTDKVQEYYSLRCVPQILGPVYDTMKRTQQVLEDEVNSVSDNPIVDHEKQNVFHGGNFHGDYVSLEMDKLKIVVTKLSMLAERQLNYLLNDKLNQKLPPFINLGKLGLNFGMQGMQFTATSTTAENQTLSFPMYLHSIPNNNDNQDIVSMGCNGALLTRRVIDNSFDVLAIQAIALSQAVDYLKYQPRLSPMAIDFYESIRKIIPPIVEDQPRSNQLRAVKEYLKGKPNFLDF